MTCPETCWIREPCSPKAFRIDEGTAKAIIKADEEVRAEKGAE